MFIKNEQGSNYILQNDDIFLSYNSRTGENGTLDQKLISHMAAKLTGEENGKEETALLYDDTWYILNGDFRAEYLDAFPNIERCLEVYKQNIQHRSGWSTD